MHDFPEQVPHASVETIQTWLHIHVWTWDQPTLAEEHPEIIDWITARYHVGYDLASSVVLMTRDGRVIPMDTNDVRDAVAVVLAAAAEGSPL